MDFASGHKDVTIVAVEMRDLSKYKELRTAASSLYKDGSLKLNTEQRKKIPGGTFISA